MLHTLFLLGLTRRVQAWEGCASAGGPVSMDVASASVDVLCLAPRSLPILELPDNFIRPALKRQLAAMRAAMLEEGCTCNLKALHFQPPSWVHPLTILYPLQASAGKVKSILDCYAQAPHTTSCWLCHPISQVSFHCSSVGSTSITLLRRLEDVNSSSKE